MGSRVVTANPNAACSPEMDTLGKTGSNIHEQLNVHGG
jgi:hypothetical protein